MLEGIKRKWNSFLDDCIREYHHPGAKQDPREPFIGCDYDYTLKENDGPDETSESPMDLDNGDEERDMGSHGE